MGKYDWSAESRRKYAEMLTELYFDKGSALHMLRTDSNTCLFISDPGMAQSFDAHSSAVSYTRQSDYTHVSGQVYGQATYLEDWFIPNRGSKQDEFGRHTGVFVLTNVAAPFYVMGEGKVSLRGSGFLGGSLPFDSLDRFSTPEMAKVAGDVASKMKRGRLSRAKKEELNAPLPDGVEIVNRYHESMELLVFHGFFNTNDEY